MDPEPRTVTIPEALQAGVQHHQAGRLAEAERIYRQILAVEPANPHALQLLGLAWKGDPNYGRDTDRSIRLADLKPLFAAPGVRFVSLQKDLDEEERALTARMENFVHPGASFKDTARLFRQRGAGEWGPPIKDLAREIRRGPK